MCENVRETLPSSVADGNVPLLRQATLPSPPQARILCPPCRLRRQALRAHSQGFRLYEALSLLPHACLTESNANLAVAAVSPMRSSSAHGTKICRH